MASAAAILFWLKLPFLLAVVIEARINRPFDKAQQGRILQFGFALSFLAWIGGCYLASKLFGHLFH